MSLFDRFMTVLTVLFICFLLTLGYTAFKNKGNVSLDSMGSTVEESLDSGKSLVADAGDYVKETAKDVKDSSADLVDATKEKSTQLVEKSKEVTANVAEKAKDIAKSTGKASNSIVRTTKDQLANATEREREEEEEPDVYLDEEEDKNLDYDREDDLDVETLIKKEEAKKLNGASLVEEKPKSYDSSTKRIDNTAAEEKEVFTERGNVSPSKKEKQEDYDASHPYWVIAGTFKSKSNAKSELKRLEKLGYRADLVQFNKSNMHSLCVKKHRKSDAAKSMIKELKSKHKIEAYMHRYKK